MFLQTFSLIGGQVTVLKAGGLGHNQSVIGKGMQDRMI